jgi:hypothetical protein
MPHPPGELDLTNYDIDILPDLPDLKIERLPELTVPGKVSPTDPIGQPEPPDVPRIDLPGLIPPAIREDDPPAKVVLPLGNPFSGRSGAARAKLVKQNGGTAESEKAVALGLEWLARQQKQDGSWQFDQGSKEEVAASTGLVLQAFLGAGETHKEAKDKEDVRKHTKVVAAGVAYLMKLCPINGPNAGRMSTNMYSQGIVTTALVEAYGMTKDPVLKPYAQAAINFIQRAQGSNGSWGYGAGSNGDTSIVGWQVQALTAALRTKDLVVDERVIKKAVKFLDTAAAGSRKSMYGYADSTGAFAGTALTASGLWSRACIDNWGPEHPGMIDGAAGLLKNPPPGTGAVKNLYYYHYATQVLRHCGGASWQTWNEGTKKADGTRTPGMRDWLVGAQITKDDSPKSGSWDPELGWFGSSCGRLGTTAVCVLQLEVYYRFVPAEKKEEKKDDPKK